MSSSVHQTDILYFQLSNVKSTMFSIPKDPKKIKQRIRRYELALKKEKEEHGFYDDSAGKRYMLGPMYLYLEILKVL